MSGVHIGHDCNIGDNVTEFLSNAQMLKVTIASNSTLAGHVHVAADADIGGGAGTNIYRLTNRNSSICSNRKSSIRRW